MRDINLEDTIYIRFTTLAYSTGAPTTLSGTPVLSVYEENNTTQITSGVSLSVDYDSVTGLNQATIAATNANGYETGKSYDLVITTGTVNGVSVVGQVVGSFTIGVIAKSSQVQNLTNVGSAVHKSAGSYVLTTGTQSANLFSDTAALDGIRHTHTDTAGALDLYYEFSIGSGTPSSVQCSMYVTGGNDDVDVYGYDWVAAGWVQIGNIQGSNSTSNQVHSFDMYVDMVGSGSDEGKVRVRYYKASGLTSATMAIDQLFVAFSQGSEGYDNGSIWVDTVYGNTNTVVGIDGVSRNPVTYAAANTLKTSTNLDKFQVSNDSAITFAHSQADTVWDGHGYTLALGGQDTSNITVIGANSITGTGTMASGEAHFIECEFSAVSVGESHFKKCGFDGTLTLSQAADYFFVDCYSQVAGTTSPTIDVGAAIGATNVSIRRWAGGITINNLAAGDVVTLDGIFGTITLNGADAAVEIRGIAKTVTNNLTGSPTVNDDSLKADSLEAVLVDTAEIGAAGAGLTDLGGMSTAMKAEINAEADTALTDYDPPTNTEMEARTPSAAELAYIVDHAKTAAPVTFTGGTTTTAILENVDGSAASSVDDFYNGAVLVFNAGTLDEQRTDITDYVGSTKTATITAVTTSVTSSHTAIMV